MPALLGYLVFLSCPAIVGLHFPACGRSRLCLVNPKRSAS